MTPCAITKPFSIFTYFGILYFSVSVSISLITTRYVCVLTTDYPYGRIISYSSTPKIISISQKGLVTTTLYLSFFDLGITYIWMNSLYTVRSSTGAFQCRNWQLLLSDLLFYSESIARSSWSNHLKPLFFYPLELAIVFVFIQMSTSPDSSRLSQARICNDCNQSQ